MKRWLIMFWALTLLAADMALILSGRPAQAQGFCAPLPDLLASLEARFGEFVVMTGKAGDMRLIVTRADDGSWSLVRAMEDVGCLIASGDKSEFDNGI